MTITGAEAGLTSPGGGNESGPVTGTIGGDRLELRSAHGILHFFIEVRGDEMVGSFMGRTNPQRVTLRRQQ